MSDKYDYTGDTIDASWQTAPWNRDGETIPKETENTEGKITMTELPEGVDVEELTDLQEQIIRRAVRNPQTSAEQIARDVGCTSGYPQMVLSSKVANWYNENFLNVGKSVDNNLEEKEEKPEHPHPEELESVAEDETDYNRKTIPATDSTETNVSSPEPDSSKWQSYAVVGLLSFILGLLWGGRDE